MKEGAPAGKRSVAAPWLPSAKEGGIEGNEGILGGSPALSFERITALCSREIHPPVRAEQSIPGPGGEVLSAGQAVRLKKNQGVKPSCGSVADCIQIESISSFMSCIFFPL